MAEVDLFVTVNLFEATNMGAVVQNIFALGALARKAQNFQGPYLGVKLADKNVSKLTRNHTHSVYRTYLLKPAGVQLFDSKG